MNDIENRMSHRQILNVISNLQEHSNYDLRNILSVSKCSRLNDTTYFKVLCYEIDELKNQFISIYLMMYTKDCLDVRVVLTHKQSFDRK